MKLDQILYTKSEQVGQRGGVQKAQQAKVPSQHSEQLRCKTPSLYELEIELYEQVR